MTGKTPVREQLHTSSGIGDLNCGIGLGLGLRRFYRWLLRLSCAIVDIHRLTDEPLVPTLRRPASIVGTQPLLLLSYSPDNYARVLRLNPRGRFGSSQSPRRAHAPPQAHNRSHGLWQNSILSPGPVALQPSPNSPRRPRLPKCTRAPETALCARARCGNQIQSECAADPSGTFAWG
ncbi:hypothetical protein Mapa_006750 [Marchantia paleacea]|nr:hypothetical protein Mapa_006750 [Marchantia paleacea]